MPQQGYREIPIRTIKQRKAVLAFYTIRVSAPKNFNNKLNLVPKMY